MSWVVVVMLAIVTGISKACRDTIDFHWDYSVFILIKNKKLREWLRSDWTNKPDHLFWFMWDGWHFFDTLTIAGCLALLRVKPDFLQVVVFIVVAICIFQVFFDSLLVTKSATKGAKNIPLNPPSKGDF